MDPGSASGMGAAGLPANRGTPGRTRRRLARGIMAFVVVGSVILLLAGLTVTAPGWSPVGPVPARDSREPPGSRVPGGTAASASPTATGEPDWWAVLAELDARRARALADRDLSGLAESVVPGSAAWRADEGLIEQLARRDARPVGLSTRLVALQGASEDTGQARLDIVDQRSAYRVVDRNGDVLAEVPSPGQRRWRVGLLAEASAPAGWRVVEVEALP